MVSGDISLVPRVIEGTTSSLAPEAVVVMLSLSSICLTGQSPMSCSI